MDVQENHFQFTVGDELLAATKTLADNQPPRILMLHGAGTSNRERYAATAQWLATQGISSLRFDHSGHGESTGTLTDSSLTKRLKEAQEACKLCHAGPLIIFGSSMGAHTAANLLESQNVSHLVLIVPAAYTAAAENVPFTEEFTHHLRKPFNWVEATQWPLLNTYKGKLLLATGGQDKTIPQDIIRHYWDQSPLAQRCQFMHPDAPHVFTPWLAEHGYLPSYLNTLKSFLVN